MLYQSARTFHNHLGYSLMMLRKLIKGRIDNLHIVSPDCFFDICNFLRTFIDQQNDQMHIRIVSKNGFRHIFQKCGLTCFRRRHDHSSLSLTDRADQVHDSHRHCSARSFHHQTFIRENRSHVFEIITSLSFARMETIDRSHIQERAELLSLCFDTDISLDNVTGL